MGGRRHPRLVLEDRLNDYQARLRRFCRGPAGAKAGELVDLAAEREQRRPGLEGP